MAESCERRKRPLGPQVSIERNAVFTLLKQLAVDNQVYFDQCASTLFTSRMSDCCKEIAVSTCLIKELVVQLQEVAPKFDYDENTPGNGLRSLVCVVDIVVLRLICMLRVCSENRSSMMFRLSHYCKEAESFGAILRFLILAFHQVISLISKLDKNTLFPPLDGEYEQYNWFLRCIESLDASCFYGRALGFQFAHSCTRIFRVIGVVLATYSLSWETRTSAFSSLLHSGKLLLNPEERAVRIIQVTREADIEFCRGFWNLSEIPMPKLFCPAMVLCENREIPMAGPMTLDTRDGGSVQIPEPTAHTGLRPVSVKVLSTAHRIGLVNYFLHRSDCFDLESPESAVRKLPASPNLIIHCHGGGYVATTSKSHETYLRSWAKSLRCPLISIDYSLSPENPFPRPTEEVLYAYAWILNNPAKLGWTGERVCMAGDSAGGNLIISMCLRLIELRVKRLPDGIVPIYTPFLFQYLPSPSRVLSFMDPLLHMGVVIRCAAAYTGSYSDEELDRDCVFHKSQNNNAKPHKSLLEYVNQMRKATGDGDAEAATDIGNEDDDDQLNDSLQTVQVERNPSYICFSGLNVDQSLIDYFYIHPATNNRILTGSPRDHPRCVNFDENEVVDENTLHDRQVEATPDRPRITFQDEVRFVDEEEEDDAFGALPLVNDSVRMPDETTFNTPPRFSTASRIYLSAGNTPVPSVAAMAKWSTADSLTSGGGGGLVTPSNSATRLSSCQSSGSRTPGSVSAEKRKLTRSKCRSLSQSLADTAALAAGHAYDNVCEWLHTPKTPIGHIDKQKLTRAANMTAQLAAKVHMEESTGHKSHFTELLKLKLPRNALMSPMYASNEQLAQLPPIRFVACHLDPLLDDTVSFARKMRDAGGHVVSVDILDSLPHGFLNFAPMSTDCAEGARLCAERIREVLLPCTDGPSVATTPMTTSARAFPAFSAVTTPTR